MFYIYKFITDLEKDSLFFSKRNKMLCWLVNGHTITNSLLRQIIHKNENLLKLLKLFVKFSFLNKIFVRFKFFRRPLFIFKAVSKQIFIIFCISKL